MNTDTIPQGDLRLLEHPTSLELLGSAIPARLGYVAVDGTPRVTPMWFAWNGTEVVFGAAGGSPKVEALQKNPRVAISIDTDTAPYKTLNIRGDAVVTVVDGAVDEYADAAIRYLGQQHGDSFRDYAKSTMRGMARISVTPAWVSLIDFQDRRPRNH